MNAHRELTRDELDRLAEIAREAVVSAARDKARYDPVPSDEPSALRAPGAIFVTLKRGGTLRGCIGTMTPHLPLALAAADRARAAAFDDPRFAPVRAAELSGLTVEVSVLSPMEPFTVGGYDELIATLRPGIDGLLVEAGHSRATFLPAVWEELPDPASFVAALWRKAGLPARAWPERLETFRYQAQHS